MEIGRRLKELREAKDLSQGDIEKRSGLLRMYISRVENGHTVPAIETLERFARALEVPLYHLVYEGQEPPALPDLPPPEASARGFSRKDARVLKRFRSALGKMTDRDRKLLLAMAQKMAQRSR
jgi:transcriptional regulator with XRE-family HTH domain